MFLIGEDVIIHDSDFEFYLKGKPTGQYAEGKIINKNGTEYIVKLYCNEEVYAIKESYLYRAWIIV